MGKLTLNEISDEIANDIPTVDIASLFSINADLPRNAHSVFRFEVKENIEEIFQNIKKGSKGKEPKYELEKDWEGNLRLSSTIDPYFYSTVRSTKDGLEIETSHHYKYNIKKNHKGGTEVTFNGPVNGLLNQDLLPKMTYVPNTLEGKFVDRETHKDLTPYVDMDTFGKLRTNKNNKRNNDGERGNPLDAVGYNINRHFNNELSFLPQSLPGQEVKKIRGQESYGKTNRTDIKWKKEEILERLEKREKEGFPVSGTVEADKIAEKKIKKAMMDNLSDKSR